MTTKHGWHWPREEQVANAYDGAYTFAGNDEAAARIKAGWAPLLPPFEQPVDPYQPEFDTHPEQYEHRRYSDGREEV